MQKRKDGQRYTDGDGIRYLVKFGLAWPSPEDAPASLEIGQAVKFTAPGFGCTGAKVTISDFDEIGGRYWFTTKDGLPAGPFGPDCFRKFPRVVPGFNYKAGSGGPDWEEKC